MQLYLTVRPEDTRTASAYPAGLAHAAYRIGEGSSLLSRNLLTPARSGQMAPLPGLLVLSDRSAPSIDRPAALAEAVLRECARRSYGGIVLDFDEPSREDRRRFAALLGQQCAKSRKFFYLPPSYAGAAEHPIVIVNTAISGGSFETHIREELARYGGGRNVVFDLQRLRMDFRLPARSGQGEPLTVDKKLAAVDLTASIMCMEQKMPMLVFGLEEKDSIINTVHGKFNGTEVTVE